MSKGQHGNKEAKKPKKAAPTPVNPLVPGTTSPVAAAPRQQDKKR